LYQIGNTPIPSSLFFPKASTITLIHCTPAGVSNILQPSIFPNLRQVHYLSCHPGTLDLYKRFKKPLVWLFPNSRYSFYKCMMEEGLGRVENRLIRTYIQQFNNESKHSRIDINLPGYGYIEGGWYKRQVEDYFLQRKLHTCLVHSQHIPHEYSYLYTPNPDLFDEPNPYADCGSTQGSMSSFLEQKMENDFMNHIMKDEKNNDGLNVNHPGATPFHNSSR
jgi:hypothetical protein